MFILEKFKNRSAIQKVNTFSLLLPLSSHVKLFCLYMVFLCLECSILFSLWTVTIPGKKHKNYNVHVFYILYSSIHLTYSKMKNGSFPKSCAWKWTLATWLIAECILMLPLQLGFQRRQTRKKSNGFHQHPQQHQTREILSILKFS